MPGGDASDHLVARLDDAGSRLAVVDVDDGTARRRKPCGERVGGDARDEAVELRQLAAAGEVRRRQEA